MKRVYVNPEVCIGCHICELACMTEHSQSKDLIIAFREEQPQGLIPRNTVDHSGSAGWISASLSCRHCDEPACVQTCISGALRKDMQTGRVIYDEEQCVGCWSCLMACGFGAIKRHPIKEKIVKCDLCPGRDVPACVAACPNEALVFEEK
ncbi:4Fe-4S dicluster domain-containing protein [Desulfovulcanus sp.]